MKLVQVSVRDLVEFVLQSGDIRSGFVGPGRAVAGTRGHQKIQRSRPRDYEAEISVSMRHETPSLTLEIKGRIDGVWKGSCPQVLEEIKTTTRPLEEITIEGQPLHWGQAMVYAFIFAREHSLNKVGVQLTYLNLDSLETLELRREFEFAELGRFFAELVVQYLDWAKRMMEWREIRDSSISALAFPFPGYREGQRAFAVAVYRVLADGGRLFAQAPTGIGKTVAALFPALKALGGGKVAKIFYLTAKTVGRAVAQTTLRDLADRGLRCKVLTLTAKDKICFQGAPDCRPETCEFARGHFDRVKPALFDAFNRDSFDRESVESLSRIHRVCPFEFSLFLSLWSDVIIGDFNYAFDPRVYLRRFFEPVQEDYAFLVDEAHNLPDRAREMFSADLRKSEFSDLRRTLKTVFPPVLKSISRITPHFSRAGKAISGTDSPPNGSEIPPGHSALVAKSPPIELLGALRRFLKVAEAGLADSEPSPAREALLGVYFRATAFIRVSETFDESYICYFEPDRKDIRIKLFCLDPSTQLAGALKRAKGTVFFSATLLPMVYFVEILGGAKLEQEKKSGGRKGEEASRVLKLQSPFPRERLGLLVLPQIRTEFKVRDRSFESIAELIGTVASSRKGNYLVNFPSYKFMVSVKEIFSARHPEIRILEQKPGMSEEERDGFLATFSPDNAETLVGFVVMGGIFGEGIDLRGERLVGSIIVGVGLPQICLERDLIREFFDRKSGSGFEFAYRYPGMNRVLQAAGRVIRTERDRGVVLLLDERFLRQGYRGLFPPEWSHFRTAGSENALRRELGEFWKRFP